MCTNSVQFCVRVALFKCDFLSDDAEMKLTCVCVQMKAENM